MGNGCRLSQVVVGVVAGGVVSSLDFGDPVVGIVGVVQGKGAAFYGGGSFLGIVGVVDPGAVGVLDLLFGSVRVPGVAEGSSFVVGHMGHSAFGIPFNGGLACLVCDGLQVSCWVVGQGQGGGVGVGCGFQAVVGVVGVGSGLALGVGFGLDSSFGVVGVGGGLAQGIGYVLYLSCLVSLEGGFWEGGWLSFQGFRVLGRQGGLFFCQLEDLGQLVFVVVGAADFVSCRVFGFCQGSFGGVAPGGGSAKGGCEGCQVPFFVVGHVGGLACFVGMGFGFVDLVVFPVGGAAVKVPDGGGFSHGVVGVGSVGAVGPGDFGNAVQGVVLAGGFVSGGICDCGYSV